MSILQLWSVSRLKKILSSMDIQQYWQKEKENLLKTLWATFRLCVKHLLGNFKFFSSNATSLWVLTHSGYVELFLCNPECSFLSDVLTLSVKFVCGVNTLEQMLERSAFQNHSATSGVGFFFKIKRGWQVHLVRSQIPQLTFFSSQTFIHKITGSFSSKGNTH